jgi:hypothetical protein
MVWEVGSREASPYPDYVCLLLAALHCTGDCPFCAGAGIGLSDYRIGRPHVIGDYRDIQTRTGRSCVYAFHLGEWGPLRYNILR